MKNAVPASRISLPAVGALLAAGLALGAPTPGYAGSSEAPIDLQATPNGSLNFDGGGIFISAFFPGWATARVVADNATAEEDATHIIGADAGRPFAILRRDGSAAFKGRAVWKMHDDGTIHGDVRIEALASVTMQCLALAVGYPAEPPFGLGGATAQDCTVPLKNGRSLRLSFSRQQRCWTQDSRPWGGGWETRFGDLRQTQSFAAGEVAEWHVVLSDSDGAPLSLSEGTPVTIVAGDRWARLDWHKDVDPGSALDFSGMGLQDAPAGKHGWLKAVGGHFEFEGLPGVQQRFYGVNLCFTANYPDHDLADILVERLVRCGYNAVRIHHHDGAWATAYALRANVDGAPRQMTNDDNSVIAAACGSVTAGSSGSSLRGTAAPVIAVDDIDRLDYLLARSFERGLYVTTDLYVSRKVPWRDIGEERDGNVPGDLYKTLVGCDNGAFADWCRWAQVFLDHVNPYTGRAYKDEPGMPLISLVNEGKLGMGYAEKSGDSRVQAAWREFCAGEDRGVDSPRPLPSPGASGFDDFEEWLNRRVFERCSAFVRSLGCKALLTNDNNGSRHSEGEGCTPLYDYVDSHFYVDHPQFLEEPWKLPSRCINLNPVKADNPSLLHRSYALNASKPYVISEWNFCGPGRYRGVGGIITGALAAEGGWDGLWRFAYSHSNRNLADGKGGMGYFDCVTDPLVAASDRAAVCLFLGCSPGTLSLDAKRGSMTIVSPLLCGGFAESGRIDAGPLSFEIGAGTEPSHQNSTVSQSFDLSKSVAATPVAATLWVTSLDGAPIPSSSRMLLVHLTDVQGDGARYADETRQILEHWGGGCLIECGEAEVELRLAARAAPTVYSLDTAGKLTGEVPSTYDPATGTLRFRVSTRGPDGFGRIFYEVLTSIPNQGEKK